jgi:plasmid stability protein
VLKVKQVSNITLNVPEDVLQNARVLAAKRNTTVNAMVRDYLTGLTASEDRVARARRRLRELSEKSTGELGPITWKREDLYDR